jgi:glucans biosynthesis protein
MPVPSPHASNPGRYTRRDLLRAAAAAAGACTLQARWPVLAAPAPETPFSFDALTQEAQRRAAAAYVPPPALPRALLDRLDYDALGRIHFDPACAVFRDGPGAYPVTFFHVGRFAPTPVRVFVLTPAGAGVTARELTYDSGCFQMPADSPAHALPRGIAGFAGLRYQESRLGDQHKLPWQQNDWVAFLGASYYRAIGDEYQYGISARGIALNVAGTEPEEFPAFTRFYLAPPADAAHEVTLYALLEGPSLAGAYRFVMHRTEAVVMEVEARLFLRRAVARLGVAPLTSMYWYSETTKPTAIDWRPEVHDSDGLALWTRDGEHVWRPLNNPAQLVTSAFGTESPRGFGLLQRDHAFDHYLDGVHYERRPSLWVEPLDDWGRGTVQLVEAPTDDEIQDNVVAMWVPESPPGPGARLRFRYRMYWRADEPFPSTLARCIATRLGRGGQPGQPRPGGVQKFVVEFLGGPLTNLPFGTIPELVLSAARGRFSYMFAEAVPDGIPGHWRAQFDFTPEGHEVVEIRLFLKSGDQALSETWLYQYRPA